MFRESLIAAGFFLQSQYIHSVSGADPDGRSASYGQGFNSIHQFFHGIKGQEKFPVGKLCLVDDDDRAAIVGKMDAAGQAVFIGNNHSFLFSDA